MSNIKVISTSPSTRGAKVESQNRSNQRPSASGSGWSGSKTPGTSSANKPVVKSEDPSPSAWSGSTIPGKSDDNKSGVKSEDRPTTKTVETMRMSPAHSEMTTKEPDVETALPVNEKKFTGRCRLFVGNLPNDMQESDFRKLFEPYGELSEVFVNGSRGFGFVRLDTRHHAENARGALDGFTLKGRPLRVRFAAHGAALRVKYLSPHVSNEVLSDAFSMFGEVERAVVVVDDRGKATGEGVVEFARKPVALTALKRISEGVFLMSSSPRPVAVEMLEQNDEIDGLPEAFFNKSADLLKDREPGPRFAPPGSFEYEFGLKWKTLYQMLQEQQDLLKKNFEDEVSKMEMDMEAAMMEQHTNMLRQDLMRRQEELRRLEEKTQMEISRRMEIRRQEDEKRRLNAEIVSDSRRREEMKWRGGVPQPALDEPHFSSSMDRSMRGGSGDRGGMMPGPSSDRGSNLLPRPDRGPDRGGPLPHPPMPPSGGGMDRQRPIHPPPGGPVGGPGMMRNSGNHDDHNGRLINGIGGDKVVILATALVDSDMMQLLVVVH